MQSYLTIEEAAAHLKVDATEVQDLVVNGKLRAIKIGQNVRIPEQELEKLVVTSPAHSTPHPETSSTRDLGDGYRSVRTRSGRATFGVRGLIGSNVEILPGKSRYPIPFPAGFWNELLAKFAGSEVAVGGSFDGPTPGSLGEFIQKVINTKMNPAVYVAALLIAEGLAEESRRGYIRFRHSGNGAERHPA
jgi:excisionase family DNA binding protein